MEGAEGQLPPVVDQDSHVVRDLFEAFLEECVPLYDLHPLSRTLSISCSDFNPL